MAFTEDLATFFDIDDFAVAVTLDGVPLVGAIFDNGYTLGGAGPVGVATTQPAITLPSANVPAEPVGKAVVYGGNTYTVTAHEPDGTGVSVLLLERAA